MDYKKYIGKKFLNTHFSTKFSCVCKILFYDEEWNRFVYKRCDYNWKQYGSLYDKDLNSEYYIFSVEQLNKIFKDHYVEKQKLLNWLSNFNKEQLAIIEREICGITEGYRNINSFKHLNLYYNDKYYNYDKFIAQYQKGIRRNKKVLFRFLDNEKIELIENLIKNEENFSIQKVEYELRRFEEIKNIAEKYLPEE